MKAAHFFIGLALSVCSIMAQATDYQIDKDHSSVEFKIRHLTSKVSGAFTDFSGAFSYDEKKPNAFKLNAVIQTSSINTRNEKRDKHLRNEDFFNVTKFPTMVYVGKSAKKLSKDKGVVEGELTLLGKTLPVALQVESHGEGIGPSGIHTVGLTVTGKIDRKKFGMVYNKALDQGGFVLSDEVDITIELEAAKNQPDAEKGKTVAPATKK